MKTIITLLIIFLAILGVGDTSYLTYEKMRGVIPPCGSGFECGTVLQSPWSMVGPFPLSSFGLVFYSLVLTLSLTYYLGKTHLTWKKVTFHTLDALALLASAGFLMTSYFVFLMGVIIQAWCLFCLVSAGLSSCIFVASWSLRHLTRKDCHHSCNTLVRTLIKAGYQWFLKPLFFLIDAEIVHNHLVKVGEFLGQSKLTRNLVAQVFAFKHPRLHRTLAGLKLSNPIGLAAGFDYNAQLVDVLPAVGFGFATVGTVTLEPYAGNSKPRLGRMPHSQALLVNKGFKSPGAAAIIRRLENRTFAIPIGISIGSTNREFKSHTERITNIVACFKLFEKSKVKHAYYELNISCPNVKGGQPFTTPEKLKPLLDAVEKLKIKKPIFLKMPIDNPIPETMALLKSAKKYTIAGVIFGNLTKDKTNPDVHPADRELWKTKAGNLSGLPTRKRSLALIKATRKTFGQRYVIIGTGGIFTAEDAKAKLKAGADALQLITGMIYQGPQVIGEINQELVAQSSK